MGWLSKLFKKQAEPVASARQHVKQSLHATVIRACKACGAAGTDETGKDVGPVCPKCGADRPKNEVLGEIWRRYRSAD